VERRYDPNFKQQADYIQNTVGVPTLPKMARKGRGRPDRGGDNYELKSSRCQILEETSFPSIEVEHMDSVDINNQIDFQGQ
jgi:hypothetical protein